MDMQTMNTAAVRAYMKGCHAPLKMIHLVPSVREHTILHYACTKKTYTITLLETEPYTSHVTPLSVQQTETSKLHKVVLTYIRHSDHEYNGWQDVHETV